MKKLALILAVALLAAPAFAATVTVVPTGPGTADINYNNDGEDVAAYAIDITLSAGEVNAVTNFHVGVSVDGDDGYGIFPANFDRFITVNGQGDVDDWGAPGYTPVADVNDKGAVASGGITIELGALYKGDSNKPAGEGTLCSIEVTEGCDVTLALNIIRGGIVLANAGAPASVTLNGGTILPPGPDECMPASNPLYNDWVALGKPECWCLKTQCNGDADGLKEVLKAGTYRVHFRDMSVVLAGWNVKEASSGGPGIASINFTDGKGTVPGACADFARNVEILKAGHYRVHFNDLSILIAQWNTKETATTGLPQDCSPGTLDPEP